MLAVSRLRRSAGAFSAVCCFAVIAFALPVAGADEPLKETPAPVDVIKPDDAESKQLPATNAAAVQPTYGDPVTTRMRIGGRVEAKGGEVQDIFMMVAVPLDCPEQKVQVVDEDFSTDLGTVAFRTLPEVKLAEPGAKQMLISIPRLPSRQTAGAVATYEVVTSRVFAPKETAPLRIPKKLARDIKTFVSTSPFINVGDRKIRDAVEEALQLRVTSDETRKASAAVVANRIGVAPAATPEEASKTEEQANSKTAEAAKPKKAEKRDPQAAAELAAKIEKLTDWERVEALYDFVRARVKYLDGAEDMPAIEALKNGQADCYGLSALFVAMCRTMKVPARMVWVDNHQYAEFYLEDETGKGYWYPAQLAGTRAFGEMPTPMVIFQKGDNFRVPERRRERLRYATDHTTLQASSKHKPRVVYVREPL
ncbi:Transglutaminase-like superfamily protein [Lacipirellula limnantheis]|uniref:Transglutaminase-like superfamily protein n=1 Tax=Lacipirellula limnantheis TaxID=2528024 RepID=A0A517TW04_9BACT|nr:Transglutaminase-like superfamily protein [Lacipirellula limnantheis]